MDSYLQTENNAVWIPEVIANEAIGVLGAYLNLGNTVTKDSELTPVRVGQKVFIPRRGAVVATQKAQGEASTKQKPTADDVEVTIDQHWEVVIGEEDFTRAFQQTGSSIMAGSGQSALPGYAEDGVIKLAEKIESSLAANIAEFEKVAQGYSPESDDTALKALGRGRTHLVKKNVPKLARKYAYIAPEFAEALGNENAFIDPKLIANTQALTEGTVGRARGFDTFEGQLVPVVGDKAQNFLYTRSALVLATRPLDQIPTTLGVESSSIMTDAGLAIRAMRYYDPEEKAVVISLDTLFGSGVNDVRQGVVLESPVATEES